MNGIEEDAKELLAALRQGGESLASRLFQEKSRKLKYFEALILKEKFLSMLGKR